MFRRWFKRPYRKLALMAIAAGVLSAGCGNQYVLLHPEGPVAKTELHLMILASVAMAIVIAIVFALLFYVVIRFRDTPGNKAPYLPEFHSHKVLEVIWWIFPAVLLTVIAIPTVRATFNLAHLPKSKDPVVIDVTSLSWKWLFQYPGKHIATVNYVVIPAGTPVLFELTADSAMNTFWVPQLGGMEYTMPNRVLPLWLEAYKPGTYWGHSGQYSGVGFAKMFFNVKAVTPTHFSAWEQGIHTTKKPMSLADYEGLLKFNTVGVSTYSNYPAGTFPSIANGFTLTGNGMYTIMRDKKDVMYMPMTMP